MSVAGAVRAVTTLRLSEMKQRGEKIAMLTSYDYSTAKIVDAAGVDVILVGDSAANVMAGYETTLPITLDMMIYHARSVVRGVTRALVVVDLPFGTYQGNSKVALDSAVRIMKETEADAVKIEGGEEILESVQRILSAGIPLRRSRYTSSAHIMYVRRRRPRPRSSCTTHIFWTRRDVSVWCWRRFPQCWPNV